VSATVEQRATNGACAAREVRVVRDGRRLALAVPRSEKRARVFAVECSSAAAARHALELFSRLNVGTTPEERLGAAVLYAEAAPVAAARRMRGRR
jgi:hypothetical protein